MKRIIGCVLGVCLLTIIGCGRGIEETGTMTETTTRSIESIPIETTTEKVWENITIGNEWLFDEEGNYRPFFKLDERDYWKDQEAARLNDWIINENNKTGNMPNPVISNRNRLLEFCENTWNGQQDYIRVQKFYDDQCYLVDVFYDGELYYTASYSEKEMNWDKKGFKYLQVLESTDRLGRENRDYVLSNVKDLTHKQLFDSIYSSSKGSIPCKFIADECLNQKSINIDGTEWLDEGGNYTGFEGLNSMKYSFADAEKDKAFYVTYLSYMVKPACKTWGENYLQEFLKKTETGQVARLRFVRFERYMLFPETYAAVIRDVLYDGEKYYIADMVEKSFSEYQYLHQRTGEAAITEKAESDTYLYYLLSDKEDFPETAWTGNTALEWKEIIAIHQPEDETKEAARWWNGEKGCYECPNPSQGDHSLQVKQWWNLPTPVLEDISTENLLEIVAAYPYAGEVMFFNSYKEGVESVALQFNGLEELLSREDCVEVVRKEYNRASQIEEYDFGLYMLWETILELKK